MRAGGTRLTSSHGRKPVESGQSSFWSPVGATENPLPGLKRPLRGLVKDRGGAVLATTGLRPWLEISPAPSGAGRPLDLCQNP